MWIAVWYFSWMRDMHVNCSWSGGFYSLLAVVVDKLFFSISRWKVKRQENSLSVFVFEETEELKIWWNWGFQCGMSFVWPWAVLQPRWMPILSRGFSFVCRQWTLRTLACKVRLLAQMLVPPWHVPFLASWGMVIKNIWRSKRCKVEQHNTILPTKSFV